MNRNRNWCFTSYEKSLIEFKSPISYIIAQDEICPDTHREHIQGYVEFDKAMTMGMIKKLFNDNKIHLEPRKGNQNDAIKYCTKAESKKPEGRSWQWGEPKKQGERNDIHFAVRELEAGKSIKSIILERPSNLRVISHLIKLKYMLNDTPRTWATELHILIGPTRCGKTRKVWEKEDDLWALPEGTSSAWFDNYIGQEAVIIDDYAGQIRYEYLLQITDRYPMQVNSKGGMINWNPKRIYITSNYDMETWYPGQDISALIARCTSVQKLTGNTIPSTSNEEKLE